MAGTIKSLRAAEGPRSGPPRPRSTTRCMTCPIERDPA